MALPVRNIRLRLLIPAIIFAVGCKPTGEPQFPWGPPPESYPFHETAAEPSDPEAPDRPRATPVPALNEPDAGSAPTPDAGSAEPAEEPSSDIGETDPVPQPDAGVVDPVASEDASAAPNTETSNPAPDSAEQEPDRSKLPPLHPAIVAGLSRKATRKQRLEARRLNTEGLHRHKKKDYRAAIEKYRQALASHGRARFPRYNLACALALEGNYDEALQHLMALRDLGHESKLADARTDSDFESFRRDPRFARLTGYSAVEFMRRPGATSSGLRRMAVVSKRLGRHGGVVGGVAAVRPSRGTVYYEPAYEDPARKLADAIGFAFEPKPAELVSAADIVVVLVKDAEIAAAEGRALEQLYGRKLHGKSKRGEHVLLLKGTGFFTERIYSEDDDSTLKRTGTFTVEDGDLLRSYRETRETEDSVTGPDQRSDRLGFVVKGKVLVLDGVRLKP